MTRSLSAAFLLLLIINSCAPLKLNRLQDLSGPIPPGAKALVEAIEKREYSFIALRSFAQITYETMLDKKTAQTVIMLQYPRSLRIEFMSPAGLPYASFASDGKTYQYLDYNSRQFTTKKLTPDSMKEALGIPVEYSDLWYALSGQIPFPFKGFQKVEQEGTRLHAIAETRPRYETRVIYDITSNLPSEKIDSDEVGVDLTILRFGDFQKLSDFMVPQAIIFANPVVKVVLRYSNTMLNDVVDDDAFLISPPWENEALPEGRQ